MNTILNGHVLKSHRQKKNEMQAKAYAVLEVFISRLA
jgi:hypothetical protein